MVDAGSEPSAFLIEHAQPHAPRAEAGGESATAPPRQVPVSNRHRQYESLSAAVGQAASRLSLYRLLLVVLAVALGAALATLAFAVAQNAPAPSPTSLVPVPWPTVVSILVGFLAFNVLDLFLVVRATSSEVERARAALATVAYKLGVRP